MKQIFLIAWLVVFVSLACLSTSAAVVEVPPVMPEMATRLEEVEMLTVTPSPLPSPDGRGDRVCAVVVAERSLHLRSGPSADDIVLTWLPAGEVVQVIDQVDADWWRVRFEGFEGFVRSMYLEFADCEKGD